MSNTKIKGFFAYALIMLILFGCFNKDKTFTGYLVAKEYTPEHMNTESQKTISYAILGTHPMPMPPRYKIRAKWNWYIANRDEVIQISVSKEMFDTKKCGDKITIKRW